MSRMYNPAHPGELIAEHLAGLKEDGVDISVSGLARHIGVTRATLSRIINTHHAISSNIAISIQQALGISAELLLNMQISYDLWQTQQQSKPEIPSLVTRPALAV